LLVTFLLGALFLTACDGLAPRKTAEKPEPPPLVDTLVMIFEELKEAAVGNRFEAFLDILDETEAARLRQLSRAHGFGSLRSYLEHQFAEWPDPDTLAFEDFFHRPPYARVALSGTGARMGRRNEFVRYTFLLFKWEHESWRLTAVSRFEKERFDPYGSELSYLETELPPKLRFPRLF
jgi:hypothetical protein